MLASVDVHSIDAVLSLFALEKGLEPDVQSFNIIVKSLFTLNQAEAIERCDPMHE
jgi:hypothetical protein